MRIKIKDEVQSESCFEISGDDYIPIFVKPCPNKTPYLSEAIYFTYKSSSDSYLEFEIYSESNLMKRLTLVSLSEMDYEIVQEAYNAFTDMKTRSFTFSAPTSENSTYIDLFHRENLDFKVKRYSNNVFRICFNPESPQYETIKISKEISLEINADKEITSIIIFIDDLSLLPIFARNYF